MVKKLKIHMNIMLNKGPYLKTNPLNINFHAVMKPPIQIKMGIHE